MEAKEFKKKVIENPQDFQLCFNKIKETNPRKTNVKSMFSEIYNSENCKVLQLYKKQCRLY
jgi:hypothetical protein